ncbi:MAG: hypothetical protein NVSMB4_13620 [Acidimicrobiales bacterium]
MTSQQIEIDFTPLPAPHPPHGCAPLPPALITVTQAARALGIGRSKTYELIATGDLEVVHIGRAARVPVEAIDELVQRLRRG